LSDGLARVQEAGREAEFPLTNWNAELLDDDKTMERFTGGFAVKRYDGDCVGLFWIIRATATGIDPAILFQQVNPAGGVKKFRETHVEGDLGRFCSR
jgi:hypothetical protein